MCSFIKGPGYNTVSLTVVLLLTETSRFVYSTYLLLLYFDPYCLISFPISTPLLATAAFKSCTLDLFSFSRKYFTYK